MKGNKPRTHKGASKRFKVTENGKGDKIMHVAQKSRHKLSKLTGSQRRRKRKMKLVTGRMAIKIHKMLGMS
jgi:ribosomal protein L35